MKTITTVLALALVVPCAWTQTAGAPPAGASTGAPSGRQIAEQALEASRLDGSEAVMTLIIENGKGQQRVRKLAAVSKLVDGGKTEKKLSRFLAPADVKGTGFLSFDHETGDDDMWLYLPALRKTRRIVSSEKSKSFMGSEFAYADMNLPNLDDFGYKVLREEAVDGVACWVVEATPRDEDVADAHGYSKRVAWFGKDDHVLRRAVYHDLDGVLLKELSVGDVRQLDPGKKRARPFRMEMVNRQNGRRSILTIDKIELRLDLKDELFTPRHLERE